MSIITPVYGWNNCPINAIWSRHDAAPASAYQTSPTGAGSHVICLFRVIELIQAPNGDLLCFAEAHERDNDKGCVAIYMKRSTDGGQTWGTAIEVYRLTTYNYAVEYINSPCPGIYGTTLYVVFTAGTASFSGHKRYVVTSSDNGATWSAATDITSATEVLSTLFTGTITNAVDSGAGNNHLLRITKASHGMSTGFKVRFTTPIGGITLTAGDYLITVVDANTFDLQASNGQYSGSFTSGGVYKAVAQWNVVTAMGITLRSGAHAGWLMFPGDHRYTADGSGTSFSHVFAFNGSTWQYVGGVDETNSSNNDTNEASIAEWANGTLVMIMRDVASATNKRYSTSSDQGATWATTLLADGGGGRPNIPACSCKQALYAMSDGTTYLAWEKETVTRAGLHVLKFTANSVQVASQKQLWFGFSGYMGLCAIDSSTLICAFEVCMDPIGYVATNTYEQIAVVRFGTAYIDDSDTNPTYPMVLDIWLTDYASGAVDTNGQQIKGRGDYPQCGHGQASGNATWQGNTGMLIDNNGAHAPVYLCDLTNASRTLAQFFEPGLGSIIIEVECATASSTSQRVLLDTRNAVSNSRGITIQFAGFTHKLALGLSEGSTGDLSITRSDATAEDDSTMKAHAFFYVRGGNCKKYTNGVRVDSLAINDTQNGGLQIAGTTACALGRKSTSTTNPFNGTVRRIRITRGAALTLPMIAVGDTAPTLDTYYGNTITAVPASFPTSATRLSWYAPTYNLGRSYSTEYYGGYDPPKLPAIHGQGITSLVDPVGNFLWRNPSDDSFSANWFERDSDLGLCLRHANSATAGQQANIRTDAVQAAFNTFQNTGVGTILGCFKPVIADGSENCIFGNVADATTGGFRVFRTSNNKLGFLLSAGSGVSWVNLTSGFTNSPNVTRLLGYFFAIRFNVTTVQLSYARMIAGKIGAITHLATQAMTNRAGTNNAVNRISAAVDFDQSHANDCWMRDWVSDSAVLSDATVEAWGRALSSGLQRATPWFGYGYGYGY